MAARSASGSLPRSRVASWAQAPAWRGSCRSAVAEAAFGLREVAQLLPHTAQVAVGRGESGFSRRAVR